jgi:glycosyltransferase involved in cell wall biosynthesis
MMQTEQQWQDRPWLGAILLNLVFPFTFGVEVATSEAVRQVLDNRFLARLWAKRSILCYNGLDEATLQKAASLAGHCPLPEGMPEQRPRVGIVGRLTRQKGHCDLLDAMKIVLASRPANLVVVGAGPLEAALRDQADRLGIQDSVYWLGHRQDVLEIMSHLDLVVSSSLWEGFPAVLLEAMAMGVPVVATDVSGSRELVKTGETGILVPPHDPERLAEAILMILDDSLKARTMAERGRQLVHRFTIQDAAARYTQIYRQVKAPHKTAKESGD